MKTYLSVIICCCLLATGHSAAQTPYSYAPDEVSEDELSALGGNKSQFVQGLVCFDPITDPALARLRGHQVKGVRCYLRADYKQARQKRSAVLASVGSPGNNVRTVYTDLTEGWNDVYFDEPLTLGEEAIYLGMQVYETLGTPYPLVAYAPVTVAHSCLINQGKKSWEEYTDRGTLLVAALLDDEAASELKHTAYAQNTTHPQTIAPDADFTGGLYIHNFDAEAITSFELTMQGEGATEPTRRTITLKAPLKGYGGRVLQTKLHTGITEGTAVDWTATITQINGESAQTARPGTTKLYVTRDDFQRIPLVEEFTSQRCVNCPQMAYFLEKAFEQYEGDYVYLAHHSGFVEDVFTTNPDREIVYVFGGYENQYNPAIMYNRMIFEGENGIIQGLRDMSPTPFLEALDMAAETPAMAEVNIQEEQGKVHVSGRVAHDLISTPLYISCYLVEDGINTDKYPQMGMDDEDAPKDLYDVFRHNGVILHYFTKDAIGDLLQVSETGTFDLYYNMVSKDGFGGTGRRLVALIHKVNKNTLKDNYVLNVNQYRLSATGITVPNNKECTQEASTIYDLMGRRIGSAATQSVPQRPGIYLINRQKVVVR
ncbi:MAG: hypothetical protein K6C30_04830 [Bacteroidaceae bacterium]|nr:hypothetical protein [Bacteroidaceae bacterium]